MSILYGNRLLIDEVIHNILFLTNSKKLEAESRFKSIKA